MRQYTGLDMIRMSRLAREIDLGGAALLKEYNNRFPEKSAKEQLENLANAIKENFDEDEFLLRKEEDIANQMLNEE